MSSDWENVNMIFSTSRFLIKRLVDSFAMGEDAQVTYENNKNN